jgi:hypothetical protein
MDALAEAGTNQVGILATMTGALPAFDPGANAVQSGAGFLNLISVLITPDALVIPKLNDASPAELAASLIRSMLSPAQTGPLSNDAMPPPKQKQDRDDDQQVSLSGPALPPIALPPMAAPAPIPAPAPQVAPAPKEAAPQKAPSLQDSVPTRVTMLSPGVTAQLFTAQTPPAQSGPPFGLAFGALLTKLDAEAAPVAQPPEPPPADGAPQSAPDTPQSREAPALQPSPQPAATEEKPKPTSHSHGETVAASTNTIGDRGADVTRAVNTSVVNASMETRTVPETLAPPHRTIAAVEAPRPAVADAIRGSELVHPMAEQPLRTSPAQEIAVRITQPDAPAVDLHVSERNGQVQVAVRTPDAGFQTSLRQDLGTLVNSLERAGYHAVTFMPHANVVQASSMAEAGSQSDRHDSHGGFLGSDSGASSDGRQQQQRQRNHHSQDWLEELEKQS